VVVLVAGVISLPPTACATLRPDPEEAIDAKAL
jgi:hypothetical protein